MHSEAHLNQLKYLIPEFSETSKNEVLLYFSVYEKYADEISRRASEDLSDHPVFGPIIAQIPPEQAQSRNKLSQELQRDAIKNNNWLPLIRYQLEQGIAYAKMGLDFKSWFELISLMRSYIRPYLIEEHRNSDQLVQSLNGMNRFMDVIMGMIGESYMMEKEGTIIKLNEELEGKVALRTMQLETLNKELEAFSYSVSHDLRAPLRAVNGYAEMLNEDYGNLLDTEGKRILNNISYNALKMGILIDDLLAFSRLGRKEIQKSELDMNTLARSAISEIGRLQPHKAKIQLGKLHIAYGDYSLVYQVFLNLLSNAVKYTSKLKEPKIEIYSEEINGEVVFSVRDNGAGFDMKYADKLFGVFQRLHSQEEYDGTGVGLAIVQRVIAKHEGRVWGEAKVNEGAVFNFILNKK